MSLFLCDGCQRVVDSDFVGIHDIDDKQYCDNCAEELDNKSNALSLKDAADIVKPISIQTYDAPGLLNKPIPGVKMLTDEERDAMQKRFIDSATFLEVK